jgi:hypothetical protein
MQCMESHPNGETRDDATGTNIYVPLDKPPQALSLTVRKIVGRVLSGEIRVPPFQRPLRWRADDVVKLFDSILKGYPIGSLLFWKHRFEATDELRIGNALERVGATSDGWYIVDGQQRTTALAAALLDLDQRGSHLWVVRFDPRTNHFLSGPPDPADRGRHVPLSVLGDLRRLGKWLPSCDLDETEQRRVEDVQQRLLDYEIPAYLTETEDADALRAVFARLNSTGVRMHADEVFQALLGTDPGDGRGPHGRLDLVELQRACDLDAFGQPPRSEVLKAVLAMSDADPSKRLEDLGEDAVSRLVAASDAAEALVRVVSFLQTPAHADEPGAEIPAYAFLPYPVVFIVLARWFHIFPEPDAATRLQLSRWLWRGVATGVHQRAAVSAMRLQVRAIRKDGEDPMGASLRRLLAAVGEPSAREWSLDPFHANHAASRVELLMLLSRAPHDKTGPVSWRALVSSGQRVAREIFASNSWTNLDAASQDLARTAANRVLLDTQHTGLRVELKKWAWPVDREILESHLIDQTSHAALESDPPLFLRHRGARIRTEVSAFLSKRAGLGEPLLFPTNSYYEAEPEG